MNEINFIPLGGQDELNKEMYALEFNNEIYLLDAGIELPVSSNYGIKFLVPKYDYLISKKNRVKGIFLSTGEYSKIGSLEYLIKEFPNINIYGSETTLKTLNIYFGEKVKYWNLIPLQNRKQIIIGNIIVIPFLISSTTPNSYAYKFKSNQYSVTYLTNYVFDSIYEYKTAAHNIFPNPKETTTVLLTDGFYGADKSNKKYTILSKIEEPIKLSKGRVLISVYNHDIFNIIEILSVARKYQKKVFFTSEIMFNLIKMYIEDRAIQNVNINLVTETTNYSKDSIIVINEDKSLLFSFFINIIKFPKATLNIDFKDNDTFILASPPISGNEHLYADLESELSYLNSEIIEISPEDFKSIRPGFFDLKNYIQVIKPKYLIPVNGYYKEQIQLQKIFTELDNPTANFIITFNGQKSTFVEGQYTGTSTFPKQFGSSIIENGKNVEISQTIIDEREQLGNNGVITIGVIVSSKERKIVSNPDVQMRGVVFLKNQSEFLERITEKFIELTEQYLNEDEIFDKNKAIHKNIKEISKLTKAEIKKTPIIIIKVFDKDGKN